MSGAQVTGKFDLDTRPFRDSVSKADSDWKKFRAGLKSGSDELTGAIANTGKLFAGAWVTGMGAAAAGFGSLLKDGISLNSQIEGATATFRAFTGDVFKAKQIVKSLREEAAQTPFAFQDMLAGGRALISVTKGNRDELMKLIKTSEILVALNPTKNFGEAAFSLKEYLSGDRTSIVNAFNLSKKAIMDVEAQGKKGLPVIQQVLTAMGATPKLVDLLADTMEGRQGAISDFFDEFKADLARETFDELSSGFRDLGKAINDNRSSIKGLADEVGHEFGQAAAHIREYAKQVDGAGAKDIFQKAGGAAAQTLDFGGYLATMGMEGLNAVKYFGNKLTSGIDRFVGDTSYFAASTVTDLATGVFGKRAMGNEVFANAMGAAYDFGNKMHSKANARDNANEQEFFDHAVGQKIAEYESSFRPAGMPPITKDDILANQAMTAGQLSPAQQARRQALAGGRGRATMPTGRAFNSAQRILMQRMGFKSELDYQRQQDLDNYRAESAGQSIAARQKANMATAASPTPPSLNITLQERNPTHAIMAM